MGGRAESVRAVLRARVSLSARGFAPMFCRVSLSRGLSFTLGRMPGTMRSGLSLRVPGLRGDPTDAQLGAAHSHGLQIIERLLRHARRKIDKAVIVADIDVPDVAPVEARLVRDGTDDVPGLDAVVMPNFDAEGLEPQALLGAVVGSRLCCRLSIPCGTAAVAPRFGG